ARACRHAIWRTSARRSSSAWSSRASLRASVRRRKGSSTDTVRWKVKSDGWRVKGSLEDEILVTTGSGGIFVCPRSTLHFLPSALHLCKDFCPFAFLSFE